jgi:hypothetical protein
VGTREHDLELELLEVLPEARDPVGDLGVEAAVSRLFGQLEGYPELFGLLGELRYPRDEAGELCPLPDDFLGVAVVFPERRLGRLNVERGDPLLLRRDVKDAP